MAGCLKYLALEKRVRLGIFGDRRVARGAPALATRSWSASVMACAISSCVANTSLDRPFVRARPYVSAVDSVDELCRDAQPIAGLPHAALDHEVGMQ